MSFKSESKNYFEGTMLSLILKCVVDFWPYFISASLALYFTHVLQSEVPFMAKDLGLKVGEGKVTDINLWPFFLYAVGIVIFRTISRYLFFYPARILQKLMRMQFLKRIEAAHPTRYKSYSNGQLFQLLNNDINEIRVLMGFVLLQLVNLLMVGIVLIPKLVHFRADLLLAFIPLLLSVVAFTLILAYFQPYQKKMLDRQGDVQNALIESYEGKQVIKNYRAEKEFLHSFNSKTQEELAMFAASGKGMAWARPIMELGMALSFLLGAYLLIGKSSGAGSGVGFGARAGSMSGGSSDLILFSGFVFLLREPFMFVSWIGVVISGALGAWKRIQEFLQAIDKPSAEEERLLQFQTSDRDHLRVPFWDHAIDLTLQSGHLTAIVSETGGGKSTFLENTCSLLKLQGLGFSFVGQAPYVFNDSIEKNIFPWNTPTADDRKKMEKYLVLFGLDSLAGSIEEVLALEIGENGKNLSGGQKKRLGLIKSLLSGSEVIVWDDPFSSVDLIQEKSVMTLLRQDSDFKQRFFLLCTHRLSTVMLCDEVMLLDKEQGIVERSLVASIRNRESAVGQFFEKQMV
jgi:ATP-binding cassette subfamily B multidrug efflux pump